MESSSYTTFDSGQAASTASSFFTQTYTIDPLATASSRYQPATIGSSPEDNILCRASALFSDWPIACQQDTALVTKLTWALVIYTVLIVLALLLWWACGMLADWYLNPDMEYIDSVIRRKIQVELERARQRAATQHASALTSRDTRRCPLMSSPFFGRTTRSTTTTSNAALNHSSSSNTRLAPNNQDHRAQPATNLRTRVQRHKNQVSSWLWFQKWRVNEALDRHSMMDREQIIQQDQAFAQAFFNDYVPTVFPPAQAQIYELRDMGNNGQYV